MVSVLGRVAFLVVILVAARTFGAERGVVTVPVDYALTFDPLTAPEPIGLLGVRMDLRFRSGLRFGLGSFVSATGKRGGFLVIGAAIGHEIPLVGPLRLLPELFLGGGGGSQLPVGSGLLLRPSVTLVADFGGFTVGGGYSLVALPGVGAYSHQPFARVSAPSDLSFLEEEGGAGEKMDWRPSRWRFRPLAKAYLTAGLANVLGQSLGPELWLIGLQIDHYWRGPWLTSLELVGAFAGNAGGFSNLAVGIGYDVALGSVHLVPRLNAGAAGGGQIDTGGGIYLEPVLQGSLSLSDAVAVTAGAGYLFTVGGVLRVPTVQGGVSVALEGVEAEGKVRTRVYGTAPVDRTSDWRFVGGVTRYFTDGKPGVKASALLTDIDLLTFRFDYRLGRRVFLTASSYWPVGGNAGGYAAGLLGVGIEERVAGPVSLEARLAVGAAAGGGVPAAGGALLQLNAAAAVELSRSLSLCAGAGYLFYRSGLKTASAEVLLRYAFTFPFGT